MGHYNSVHPRPSKQNRHTTECKHRKTRNFDQSRSRVKNYRQIMPGFTARAASGSESNDVAAVTAANSHTLPADFSSSSKEYSTSTFVKAFSIIFFSELADRSFFTAAILSGQYNRYVVFLACFLALSIQMGISVTLGQVLLKFMSIRTAMTLSSLLFILFGLMGLRDWKNMKDHDKSEFEETVNALKEKGLGDAKTDVDSGDQDRDIRAHLKDDIEVGVGDSSSGMMATSEANSSDSAEGRAQTSLDSSSSDYDNDHGEKTVLTATVSKVTPSKHLQKVATRGGEGAGPASTSARNLSFFHPTSLKIFFSCFSMVFLMEWGDRSQIATINLASSEAAFEVFLGGVAGDFVNLLIAVIGGSMLADKLNAKKITLFGAIIFLLFGFYGCVKLWRDWDDMEAEGGE